MTVTDILILAFGLVTLAAAIRVVTTAHLVRAGLWLVVALGGLAAVFLVLTAELVAWVQVLIYVGAVVVLLLFAVMLTRAPIGASPEMDRNRLPGILAGGAAGLGLSALLIDAFRWMAIDAREVEPGTAKRLGAEVFGNWVLPFEILSVLLLAALVGAILVSAKQNNRLWAMRTGASWGRPAPKNKRRWRGDDFAGLVSSIPVKAVHANDSQNRNRQWESL